MIFIYNTVGINKTMKLVFMMNNRSQCRDRRL